MTPLCSWRLVDGSRGSLLYRIHRTQAPARQFAKGPFPQPALRNQSFGDCRNRAPLQARITHQIRTGNGLMLPNQIQHDATVDVPDGFVRRHLKVIEVDLAHD